MEFFCSARHIATGDGKENTETPLKKKDVGVGMLSRSVLRINSIFVNHKGIFRYIFTQWEKAIYIEMSVTFAV